MGHVFSKRKYVTGEFILEEQEKFSPRERYTRTKTNEICSTLYSRTDPEGTPSCESDNRTVYTRNVTFSETDKQTKNTSTRNGTMGNYSTGDRVSTRIEPLRGINKMQRLAAITRGRKGTEKKTSKTSEVSKDIPHLKTYNIYSTNEFKHANIDFNNNLELYLADVYENECKHKIPDKEIEFIQTAIEQCVKTVVHLLLRDKSAYKKFQMEVLSKLSSNLEKDYFQVRDGSRLKKDNVPSIIKVGSFYEGTKNNFPDEFDLIFLVFCLRDDFNGYFELTGLFDELIDKIIDREEEKIQVVTSDRQLYFDKYVGKNGPALTLRFIYVNASEVERNIQVDLVPAARFMHSSFEKLINERCAFKPFCQAILSTGKVLHIYSNILSFTETEVYFMREILSKTHKKVYQILKYLINGHNDGDALNDKIRGTVFKPYSSYMIKTMIIYHHYQCETISQTENLLGPCILQVLKSMAEYRNTETFPKLVENPHTKFDCQCCLLHYLKLLIPDLEKMQKTIGRYDYETVRNKPSVSKQYLEHPKLYRTPLVKTGSWYHLKDL